MNPLIVAVGCLVGSCVSSFLKYKEEEEMQTIRRAEEYVKKKTPKKAVAKVTYAQPALTGPQVKNMLLLDKSVLAKTKEGQIYLIIDLVSIYTVKAVNLRGGHTLVPVCKLYEYHDAKIARMGG